jgi:SAM-dependent methyltransferase
MYPIGMDRAEWDERWQERGLHFQGDPSSILVSELAPVSPGRALDLACGGGRNAVWLAENGWTVTGVDFSRAALALARKLAGERDVGVEWIEDDVRTYEPEPGAFDLVLVSYLHLPRDERRHVMAHAVSALARGGLLFVIGHHLENVGTGAPGPSNPDVLYTTDDLVADLDGLEVERAARVVRRVETDSGEAEAIDALVLARRR